MDQLEVSPCPTMEEVRRQFEVWRNANKPRSPIPSQLWDSAASLAKRHSVHEISRALRLNYAKLKNHLGMAPAKPANKTAPQPFVELPFPYTRSTYRQAGNPNVSLTWKIVMETVCGYTFQGQGPSTC